MVTFLTLRPPVMKTAKFTNSVDPGFTLSSLNSQYDEAG